MQIKWKIYSWGELRKKEIYDILMLRSEVFVVEQKCIYQDIDKKDIKATHVLGYNKDVLVAYSRVFVDLSPPIIGRVVVSQEKRRNKVGTQLIKKSIEVIPSKKAHISAQKHLKKFYESLGFIKKGNEYLEDGIPHIPMDLNLQHPKA